MTDLIPSIDLSALPKREFLEAVAQENAFRIAQDAPWITNVGEMAADITEQKGSLKAKYIRLRKLADRIASAIAPHAACQRSCSQCCHISVAINEIEADIIADATGRKRAPTPTEVAEDTDALAKQYFRQPCPFLRNNSCSIYAIRPMACRLHFSISGTNVMCDTRVPPEYSAAVNLNLQSFWFSYMAEMHKAGLEDIRYFFPSP